MKVKQKKVQFFFGGHCPLFLHITYYILLYEGAILPLCQGPPNDPLTLSYFVYQQFFNLYC